MSAGRGRRAVITGVDAAFPDGHDQDELWDGYFAAYYGGNRWAHRVWQSVGVSHRHCAFDPMAEDLSGWSTGRRMHRYGEPAVALATEAATGALKDSGLAAGDIGMLAVASCTGYVTPGVDIFVAAELGIPERAQRLLIGHMGCHAAIPGLRSTADYVAAHDEPALLVCVELSTLHVQPAPARPTSADLEQVVVHALFGDAAAAAVLEPDPVPSGGLAGGAGLTGGGGLTVADIEACTETGTAGLMTWEITDTGFRMGLDRRVPEVIGGHVASIVDDLLARNGLGRADVAGWAIHPGGPRILDVVAGELGLTEEQIAASRDVLATHGNCSSATVLLILDELRRRGCGGPVVLLAFGPGLTVYGCLLR